MWGQDWRSKTKQMYLKLPVHVSRAFVEAPSLLSALYLLLLRLQARDYAGVFALMEACATDEALAQDEASTLDALGLVQDAHPDAHACRCQLSLVLAFAPVAIPWDVREEYAHYVAKLAHVSASCRLGTS